MMDGQSFYLFLIFLCSSVQGASVVFNPCISQKELSAAEAIIALENWPDNQDISLIEHRYKCTMTCVLIDLGLVNKMGQVQIDKYVESGVLDRMWVASDLASCRSKYHDEWDLCEFVFGIFNCFREMKLAAERKV
ncbi:general odorant-binding protein 57e [Drosophila kikkawai]|uniref:General odorant-binding protein 57e n=1 Tax=Drosophila kikkawai TaxID=30033 RepID=A0A6P4IR38_DROKI|nr:general odorant-binding protein 57e [Drosophila kikkawai]